MARRLLIIILAVIGVLGYRPQAWQNVQYLPMRFDRAEIEQSARETMVLQPAGQ